MNAFFLIESKLESEEKQILGWSNYQFVIHLIYAMECQKDPIKHPLRSHRLDFPCSNEHYFQVLLLPGKSNQDLLLLG